MKFTDDIYRIDNLTKVILSMVRNGFHPLNYKCPLTTTHDGLY